MESRESRPDIPLALTDSKTAELRAKRDEIGCAANALRLLSLTHIRKTQSPIRGDPGDVFVEKSRPKLAGIWGGVP